MFVQHFNVEAHSEAYSCSLYRFVSDDYFEAIPTITALLCAARMHRQLCGLDQTESGT